MKELLVYEKLRTHSYNSSHISHTNRILKLGKNIQIQNEVGEQRQSIANQWRNSSLCKRYDNLVSNNHQ